MSQPVASTSTSNGPNGVGPTPGLPASSNSGTTSSSGRSSRPPKICSKCGLQMTGQFVRALGGMYHLECFRCMDCGQVVAARFFPKTGDDGKQYPLCERDYFARMNLLCAKCGLALRGSYIEALGRKYHVEHFTCTLCDTIFGPSESYYEHEGAVYCHYHFSTMFAATCTGCRGAILKQFVEITRNAREEQWHPECYMIHKSWNVTLAPAPAPGEEQAAFDDAAAAARALTADELRSDQGLMEEKVTRIWSVLSVFEESAAACISDMLLNVSNGLYVEGINEAASFILHVEVLFAGIDRIEQRLSTYGDRTGLLHHKEPKLLCKKIVGFFSLLSHSQDTNLAGGAHRRLGITQDLLALVTSLAHLLKVLIRMTLCGALKLERQYQQNGAVFEFLDTLMELTDQEKRIRMVLDTDVKSDLCAGCRNTIEETCVSLPPNLRWHLHCLNCSGCARNLSSDLRSALYMDGVIRCTQCAGAYLFSSSTVDTTGPADDNEVSTSRTDFELVTPLSQYTFLLRVALKRLLSLLRVKEAGLTEALQDPKRKRVLSGADNASGASTNTVPAGTSTPVAILGIQRSGSDGAVEFSSSPQQHHVHSPLATASSENNQGHGTDATIPVLPTIPPRTDSTGASANSLSSATGPSLERPPQQQAYQQQQKQQQQQQQQQQSHAQHPMQHAAQPISEPPSGSLSREPTADSTGRTHHLPPVAGLLSNVPMGAPSPGQLALPPQYPSQQLLQSQQGPGASSSQLMSPVAQPAPELWLSELSALEAFVVRHIAVRNMEPYLSGQIRGDELVALVEDIGSKKSEGILGRFVSTFKQRGKKSTPSNKEGTFAVTLESLVHRTGVASNLGAGPGRIELPAFIHACIAVLSVSDLHVEGLFRKNGNIKRLNSLRETLDANPMSALEVIKGEPPIQIAALLKKFFREMPEPLMTFRLYRLFIAISKLQDEAVRKRVLHYSLCLLPKTHRDVLEVLCLCLKAVAACELPNDPSRGSKMDYMNLATMIAPNVLVPPRGADDEHGASVVVMYEILRWQEDMWTVPDDIATVFRSESMLMNMGAQNLGTGGADSRAAKEILKRVETIARTGPSLSSQSLDGLAQHTASNALIEDEQPLAVLMQGMQLPSAAVNPQHATFATVPTPSSSPAPGNTPVNYVP